MANILMAAYTNYRRDPRVRRQAEALVEAGHRVVFLASRQPGQPARETIAGVEIITARSDFNSRSAKLAYVADYLLFFCALAGHLLMHPRRYRLIHVNNMPDLLVFATLLPRLMGTPVIHDVHDLMPEIFMEKFGVAEGHWLVRFLKFQERWAGRFASAVLTVEERLRDILGARGIPRDRIRVLMNLPDDRIFAPRRCMPAKGADAPFVVVYHGTLAHRLGLDIAVAAMAKLVHAIPRLELRIIGAGEERDRLIAQRDALGLQHCVTFSAGFVPVDQIPALLEDADVGLIPLRISGGTDIMLPTKLLEYVTMNIPCIAPKTTTICRYFDDRMVCFFDAEDVDSLARAVLHLFEHPDVRRELAINANLRFGASHRWSEHKKVYVDLVRDLLAAG